VCNVAPFFISLCKNLEETMKEKLLKLYCRFMNDRRGDEFGEKAVIIILVVVAGIAAWAAFGNKIMALINEATAGI